MCRLRLSWLQRVLMVPTAGPDPSADRGSLSRRLEASIPSTMMNCLLPVRFALLTSHLVLSTLLLSNRDFNVRLCVGWDYTAEEYRSKDVELLVGLILALVLLALESLSFLAGISMLHRKQSLFSSCQHGLGSLALACFMWDGWQCGLFWWILALTVVAPLLTEISVFLRLCISPTSGQIKQQRFQS